MAGCCLLDHLEEFMFGLSVATRRSRHYRSGTAQWDCRKCRQLKLKRVAPLPETSELAKPCQICQTDLESPVFTRHRSLYNVKHLTNHLTSSVKPLMNICTIRTS